MFHHKYCLFIHTVIIILIHFHILNYLYRNVILITHSNFINFVGTGIYYVDSSDIACSSCLSHIQRVILQRTMGT